MTLTPAQRELLKRAARETGTYTVDYYRPAQALVAKGLAEWRQPGSLMSSRLYATDEGRRILKESVDTEKDRT